MGCEGEKRIILEIGVGEKPFPTVGKRQLSENECYIGVYLYGDYKSTLANAKDRIKKHEGLDKRNVHLVKADGRGLPLRTESVDEIVFCNVFGYEKIPPQNRIQMTQDATRVLKIGGVLTVVETYTPWESPFNEVRSNMHSLGLTEHNNFDIGNIAAIDQYADGFDAELFNLPSFTQHFYKMHGYIPELPYIARFTKVQPREGVLTRLKSFIRNKLSRWQNCVSLN